MQSGIYVIVCIENHKFYIGQSKDIQERWKQHVLLLNKQKHSNRHLQHVYDKYGLDALHFQVVEYCQVSELDQREQGYLDQMMQFDTCMNIAPFAINPVNQLPRTKEWYEKISAANRGKKLSEKTKELIRIARAKQVFPPDCYRAAIEARRGKKRDPEIGVKISAALTGKKLSEAHVRRLKETHIGKAIIATHIDGVEIEFRSIKDTSVYFHCTPHAIVWALERGIFVQRPSAKLYGWKLQTKIS